MGTESAEKAKWSRSKVAAFLCCSVPSVQWLEGRGRLHPERDADGRVWFDPIEVEKLKSAGFTVKTRERKKDRTRKAVPGSLSARVFRMFREGAELDQIVEKLEVAPNVVRDLWREYERPLAATGRLDEEERAERERKAHEARLAKEQRRLEWMAFQERMARVRASGKREA